MKCYILSRHSQGTFEIKLVGHRNKPSSLNHLNLIGLLPQLHRLVMLQGTYLGGLRQWTCAWPMARRNVGINGLAENLYWWPISLSKCLHYGHRLCTSQTYILSTTTVPISLLPSSSTRWQWKHLVSSLRYFSLLFFHFFAGDNKLFKFGGYT